MFHQDQDAMKEPVQQRAGERTFEAVGQAHANSQGNNGHVDDDTVEDAWPVLDTHAAGYKSKKMYFSIGFRNN